MNADIPWRRVAATPRPRRGHLIETTTRSVEPGARLRYAELDDWGSDRLRDAILELQGFYVKSGQVLSTRVDLFAQPYTDKLQVLQEGLAPIPAEVVREVVRRELCGEGGDLGELFASFDDEQVGCARIKLRGAFKIHPGAFVATSRGPAAAAAWTFRGDESRPRRGCRVDIPKKPRRSFGEIRANRAARAGRSAARPSPRSTPRPSWTAGKSP